MGWDFVLDQGLGARRRLRDVAARLLANARERRSSRGAPRPWAHQVSTKRSIDWLTHRTAASAPTRWPAATTLVRASMDEAVAELTKRFGPDMAAGSTDRARLSPRVIAAPAVGRRQRRHAARLDVGTAAARRRQRDGERDRQRRQPDGRRLAQDRRRHRGLGQLGRPQHAGPVGRPRQPALPRPVRRCGRRASTSRSRTRATKVESVTEGVTHLAPRRRQQHGKEARKMTSL